MMLRTSLFFSAGLAAALAAGWLAFPRALYHQFPQPFEFRHKTHAAKSGSAECSGCHRLLDTGAFSGIPTNEGCAACHQEPAGATAAEKTFVQDYVQKEREVPWRVYSRQPANVRFSHAIHLNRAKLACAECHGPHGESDSLRPYEENRISGYSRDIWGPTMLRTKTPPGMKFPGMKMSDCENCHEQRGATAGCLGCHR